MSSIRQSPILEKCECCCTGTQYDSTGPKLYPYEVVGFGCRYTWATEQDADLAKHRRVIGEIVSDSCSSQATFTAVETGSDGQLSERHAAQWKGLHDYHKLTSSSRSSEQLRV